MDYWIIPGLPHGNRHQRIMEVVSECCGIPLATMKLRTRKREVVEARYMCYKALKDHTSLSLSGIGELLGGFDHATVKHGIETIVNLINTSKAVKAVYLRVEENINT